MTKQVPYETVRASAVAGHLERARQLDEKFRGAGFNDARSTPWMPFNLTDFCAMLIEALPEAPEHTFLDIGCGPGSKMIVAEEVFGLKAHGIDIARDLAGEAAARGLDAWTADALDFGGYGNYGIIWFNRVFRDRELQRDLEAKIWRETAPGAVVICAHLEDPPPDSWFIVLDDWEARRGVWKKPPA